MVQLGGALFLRALRAVGGSAHDKALNSAVQAAKPNFRQCSRCGKWVCPEVCWNHAAGQCEECAPDFTEEFASAHAHAKGAAARDQLHAKAAATDYVSGVDMKAGSVRCACGQTVNGKFCPECGRKA